MSKHFSTVLGILFLFVFTFTLVVTTASEVKANPCCPVIGWCATDPLLIAWGYMDKGVCTLDLGCPWTCCFVPICLEE